MWIVYVREYDDDDDDMDKISNVQFPSQFELIESEWEMQERCRNLLNGELLMHLIAKGIFIEKYGKNFKF